MKRLLFVAVFFLLGMSIGYAATTQYQNLGTVAMSSSTSSGNLGLASMTQAQSVLATPTAKGALIYCSNCITAICVSSGTGQGAWVNISSTAFGSASQPCQ